MLPLCTIQIVPDMESLYNIMFSETNSLSLLILLGATFVTSAAMVIAGSVRLRKLEAEDELENGRESSPA